MIHLMLLAENAVKLEEAVVSAGTTNFRDWNFCVDQQSLHVSDSGHPNVVSNGESGNILKSVGQIAAADTEFVGQTFQGKIFWKMGME
jgi:hypothetical protein